MKKLPDKDYEYELHQEEEIEKLKQKREYSSIMEQPKDYEPDINKASKEGKLTSVQWLMKKKGEI